MICGMIQKYLQASSIVVLSKGTDSATSMSPWHVNVCSRLVHNGPASHGSGAVQTSRSTGWQGACTVLYVDRCTTVATVDV